MRMRFAMVTGGALLATGLGLAATAAPQKPAPKAAPQKAAAVSMVVYKSPT
jgi:hypothetical protein